LSVVHRLLRGLLGVGGALVTFYAWPVAWGAWYALQAETVVSRLRENQPVNLPDTLAAIDAYDAAIRMDPSALRHLGRSELLFGAVLALNWAAPDSQREQWLRTAESDLEVGLAGAPARGIAWLRLAAVRQVLDGPSPSVVPPLLMSIDTAPVIPSLWPVRFNLILQNWRFLSDQQRHVVEAYVVMTWEQSTGDRRWFAAALQTPGDELFLRYVLANVIGAQDELTLLLEAQRKSRRK